MADCSHGRETESDDLRKVTDFMCKRGYTEEAIKKIDVSAVQNIDDSELSRYIPAFGDRVNLRSLSKPDTGRKAALFDKLRNFAQTEFEDKISIAEMYDTVKMGMLRFHLCTKTKNGACSENKEDELTKKSSEDLETESDNELPEIEETISDVESIRDPVLPDSDVTPTKRLVMPRSPSPPPEEKLTTIVHRVKVLEELIEMFKSPQIIKKSIQFSFINEAGADQSGVSRDVYTSFWADFFSRVAEGEDFRVPALNPQWQVEEWKSVGRILVKGLLDHNIFPLNFAPAYVTALLFGEHSISEKTLLDSFLLYLSKSERDLAKVAIERKLSADENEDFLDMLDRLGSKTIPTFENMQEELLKMAHKELIQKPKYALEKMAEVCRNEIIVQIPSEVDLLEMYESKRPSVRKVLKMISSNPRFLTGTDILCVEKIEVTFTKLIGIERRPIAHTCGPTLELPCTYMSYIEFRYELDNILQSDHCMEMNIA
uniref:HECT domain-containing protein n=1 Tax=Magallana gigas TaxID=29159 RepID=A0A8W8MHV8_MAGGI